jgi:hypothetical protein
MKKDIFALATIFSLGAAALLHSQTAEPPKAPLEVLRALKASNAQLIDQQKKTLDGLDELQKNADQLKIYGKRS